MSRSNNRWGFNCLVCPKSAYLPLYIKNVSLFSGTTNDPGFMVTEAMRYSRKASRIMFPLKRETRIIPVPQRVIPILSNPQGLS